MSLNQQRTYYKWGRLSKDRIQRLETIGFNWDFRKIRWEKMFRALVGHKKKHGTFPSSQSISELGRWVSKQRQYHKTGDLSEERIEKLEAIGFSWNALEAKWVGTQRIRYKRNTGLSPGNIARLTEIGFVWDVHDAKWETKFEQLVIYKRKHGHCRVPQGYRKQSGLATWVHEQRQNYSNEKLSKERIKRLEALGFVWLPYAASWELKFKALTLYHHRYGDSNVPANWSEDPELVNWVQLQRQLHRKGKLSRDKIDRLNTLDFDWATKSEKMLKELEAYKARFGNCNVPQNWRENPALATWVKTRRIQYKKNRLSTEHIERLNQIGFTWDIGTGGEREGNLRTRGKKQRKLRPKAKR